MSSRGRRRNRVPDPDRKLILAFQTIATIADRLGLGELVSTIKDLANEIYKKMDDLKCIRGKRIQRQDAILAACLYIACKQESTPPTVKEICAAANGVSIKETWKAVKFVENRLMKCGASISMDMGRIHARDFLWLFCSRLDMGNNAVRATIEVVKKSDKLDITRRLPISVAAAGAIYMISQLSEEKKTLDVISPVVGLGVEAIWNAYKDLYPHADQLIPEWFLKDTLSNIKNLPAP